MVSGLWFLVSSFGFRELFGMRGVGSWVWSAGCDVCGVGCGVWGMGCGVWGWGLPCCGRLLQLQQAL